MRKLVPFILLFSALFSGIPTAEDEIHPTIESCMSYSAGAGIYRFREYSTAIMAVDYMRVEGKLAVNPAAGYAFRDEDGETKSSIILYLPITYKVGESGREWLMAGVDYQSYFHLSPYEGTHTIGPTFSLLYSIDDKYSFNDMGVSLPVGLYATDGGSAFLLEVAVRNKLQVMFSDRIGLSFGLRITYNLISGVPDADYEMPWRGFAYIGPCFRL